MDQDDLECLKNHVIFATWYSRINWNSKLIEKWENIRDLYLRQFRSLFPAQTAKKFPKIHDPEHTPYFIKQLGSGWNWNGMIGESSHGDAKAQAEHCNFRSVQKTFAQQVKLKKFLNLS